MIHMPESPGTTFSRMVSLALLLLASANLHAQQPMSTILNGDSEVPPVSTSATGTGQITVLPDYTASGNIYTTGLVPTMAHIHEAAAGENGPIIITLIKTSNNSFTVPADAKLSEAQYASYMAGKLYINVHSAQYQDGEIRGQLFGKPLTLAH